MTQLMQMTQATQMPADNREALSLGGKFDEIFNLARDIKVNSVDYTVPANDVRVMTAAANDLTLRFPTEFGYKTDAISDYALGQLSGKVGVPVGYLRKCLDEGKGFLAQSNLNSWLKDQKSTFFVREHDRRVRGVLSNRYAVYDTIDALDVIADKMDLREFEVKGHYLSPERFHLRIAMRNPMNIPGEDLFAGLSIDNSDVGRSMMSVRFLVYKKVCTNGLIVAKGNGELFKQKHVGLTSEIFAEEFANSMTYFPKIAEEVEKSIKATKEAPLFYNFDYKNGDELKELIETIKNDANVSESTANNVIEIVRGGRYEQNRWGYINALTEAAQTLSLEARLDIERYAGTLLAA